VWEFHTRFESERLVTADDPVLLRLSMLLFPEMVLGMVGFLLKATLLTKLLSGAVEWNYTVVAASGFRYTQP